jgi:hypothetical protein
MKNGLQHIFLFLLILLHGCMAAPENARRNSKSTSATTTPTSTTPVASYPTFTTDEALYWFTTAKVTGTITLNKNSQDIVYLRGKSIHDFLISKDNNGVEFYRKQYCLVGNYSDPSTYKQIRVRAIPIFVTTSTRAIERFLRIDFPSSADNATACSNTTVETILATNAAFSFPEICSNCSGLVTTTGLNLYETKNSPPNLLKIESTKLSLSQSLVRVDLQSNSTDNTSVCTNASCGAKGFDCCALGQCVKDASEKINASSDPQYSQAKSDFAANPLSFINYPNIYYICTNISHVPPNTTVPTTTPTSDALARVAKYLADYTCISEATATTSSYLNCRSSIALEDKLEPAYNAIKKKLAIDCGCTAIDSQMAVKCPDWGILPVYKQSSAKTPANITDFVCYTPAPPNPIGPITNLNVNVPNRSAPHRFYATSGTSYDDLGGLKLKLPDLTQEGEDFYFLDEYNKVGPINGSFNVNSILGRMTIDLSHTMPAKEVTVELGRTYIMSATSGFFTPCAQCSKDSWFQSFTAHPNSQRGVGLQASGFTTTRDAYSGNKTFGNYEDTKFGRACFVPVTMLPMSHQKNASLKVQRQNRLKTQSAYYINGYQRDWYGFNQGALIGSFDGVTWFAVGSGRRITATSTKLYLAINASYLDLADKTDTVVNIIPDFSANTAADYDYDPELSLLNPRQNTAATCQQYHQCTNDAECVAQLGWEYACSDVSQIKSQWPLFDSDAGETANQERTLTFFELLQYTISTTTNKRCMYRGAGAPCKRNYSTLNEFTQKSLTCAPNFYCASMTSNKFNNELVRSPNEIGDILFGMDANVLGRPQNYVTANKSLDTEIISNLKYNATSAIGLSSAEGDDMGICRPGRFLSNDPYQAHSNADALKRTDYISQIGSCNSLLAQIAGDAARYASCPAFDDESNIINTTATADKLMRQQIQNSCGSESRHTDLTSAFKFIEGLSLNNAQNIPQAIVAQDACLRRAGSICHSDLDCGPNKLHEEATGTASLVYFGDTEAEQQYWRESLVCGQVESTPALGDMNYFNYKLSNNRCCREIGKDFTMYTQGPKTVIPENTGKNENLKTAQFPSTSGTSTNYRYSRYTISKNGKLDSTKIPVVSGATEPNVNQWQVINETGSLTCCGGGWIRKFSDGSHDWKVRNRLTIDANNFSCLNFRSPLADSNYSSFSTAPEYIIKDSYQREYELFCKSPDGTGCLQIPYQDSKEYTIFSPRAFDPALEIPSDGYTAAPASGYTRLDTSPTVPLTDGTQLLNNDVPYMPSTYTYSPTAYDVYGTPPKAFTFFTNRTFDYGVEFYLPAYIGWDTTLGNGSIINKVSIKYFFDPPLFPSVVVVDLAVAGAGCNNVIDSPSAATPIPVDFIAGVNQYCIVKTSKTQNRPVFIAKADNTVAGGDWSSAGIMIDFKPTESSRGTKVAKPGNPLYYLSKLARLELIGIPQITYEPLYCNNNHNNLIPGIFKSTILTRANFTAVGTSLPYGAPDPIDRYNDDGSASTIDVAGYGNVEKRFTFQDKLDHSAIFSAKDFTCCTPLGKSTNSQTKCCSGYGVTNGDGKSYTCKLPKGTDLNVYFNKFVSGEGVIDGGLTIAGTDAEIDFNKYTGEPKFRAATSNKLVVLGNNFCDGKVATGGAFGNFPPEPFSGSYSVSSGSSGNLEDAFPMSIVDSVLDFQTSDPDLGKVPYDSGFKWNHHLYCK